MKFLVPVLAACPALADACAAPPGLGPPLSTYYACEAAAQTGPLGAETADRCSRVFIAVKLAFVPGVGPADWVGLSGAERAAVNAAGYRAFKDWEGCARP
ncbi:hypothetical protein [Histidinibacterium aquaticum]|uniref:Uncharacterized protein n=1 Tax=Histidinibacterium aquaticum TaxID=2613962 RepID=A0A5J5GQJ1_9RHOB|nr:hypothetical protein [Histidinibacterium aquaticum]KAA9010521.1 hypothetical protein F3S47_04555 [Histidinibacterium aquaticum]